MKITYENLHAEESSGPTLAELLLSLEGDLTLSDGGRDVFAEAGFPVAELAYRVNAWLTTAGPSEGFVLDSMSADPGLLRIVERDGGWVVGSIFEPDSWTRPVGREILTTELRDFVQRVRADLTAMGIDPYFLPDPD
ncbi:hypothetical protein [Streptomyces sp. NPDC048644]|uniref:DUF7878 domain-containing protein n=1 Tax=Streptomyces sp. NPDC048644 TaxID=3365582 RepID=UPI00370F9E4D